MAILLCNNNNKVNAWFEKQTNKQTKLGIENRAALAIIIIIIIITMVFIALINYISCVTILQCIKVE